VTLIVNNVLTQMEKNMKNRDKIQNYFKENYISISAIFGLFVLLLFYLKITTTNVPIMDYWRYMNEITEKVFNDTLEFSDLWKNIGVQRNPLIYFLLTINMKYFGLNTQIEIYSGAIIMAFNALIIFKIYYINIIKYHNQYKKVGQVLFVIIALAVFNFNQWEIITLQFSLSFMVRIMMYLIIFMLVDNFLICNNKNFKNVLIISLLIFITVCLVSQGYFPALVGTIIVLIFLHFILSYKSKHKMNINYYLIIFISILLSSIIYLYGITSDIQGSNSIKLFIHSLLNGEFLKGSILMLGTSILNSNLISNPENITLFYIIGLIILFSYIFALFIYFKNKMYERTYFPIMLITYSLINIVLIIYARMNLFNLTYLIASRYVCETTLGIIGILFILLDYILKILDNNNSQRSFSTKVMNNFSKLIIIIISISLCYTTLTEMKTGPYRKAYFENLVEMMIDIDNIPDDKLGAFQANNPDMVRSGVILMKKYKLGVFNDNNLVLYNNYIGSTLNTAKIINGIYEDGWIEKEAQFKIKTGDIGKIIINGYYPRPVTGNETINIYIDDKLNQSIKIEEESFIIEIDTKINSIANVKIINTFDFSANEPDIRRLSFILSSVEGK